MKLSKHTLLVLAVVLTYASCKKSGSAPSNGSGKSDSTTTGGTGTTSSNSCLLSDRFDGSLDWLYTYNPDKSLSELAVEQTFTYPYTSVFFYSGDSTVVTTKNGNTPGYKINCTVTKNAQGQVATLFYETFDPTGAAITWTNFAFDYSGQNPSQCTMTVDGIDKIAFFNYTYSNGNLTEISIGPGTTFDMSPHAMSFNYDTNTPAVGEDIFWEDSKFGFMTAYYPLGIYNALYPVQNKNIVTSQTFTDSIVHTETATYNFDSNKNIIFSKLVTTPTAFTVVDSETYHYNCSN